MASRSQSASRMGRSARHTGFLPWLIISLLAVAPLAFGSTQPLAWTIWGIAVGLMAVASTLTWMGVDKAPSTRSRSNLTIAQVGFAIVCAYLVVQLLPLGDVFGPLSLTISDGSTISMRTLSVAPGDTVLMLVRMLTFALLFRLTAEAARSEDARALLLNGIVIVVTAHALHGLLALFQFGDTLLGVPKDRYVGSATASFLNRNTYATFLAIGTAVALTMAMRSIVRSTEKGVRFTYDVKSILYIVAAAIMTTTVVTTNSRAGLAVTMVGATVVALSTIASNIRALRPLLFAMPILLVLFAAMFLQLGESVWLRYESTSDSFNFRLELYRQAMQLIAQRPWTGFGGGTFELAFPIVHAGTLPNELTWNEAHNTYLELWSDLGLVVGSIPILMAGGLFMLLAVRLARSQGSWASQTAALATLAIGAVHSLFDFSLEIQAVTFLFVVLCAVGLSGTAAQRNAKD